MTRLLAALAALAACNGSSSAPPTVGQASGATTPTAPVAVDAGVAKPAALPFRIQAPPSEAIALVAVTGDGGAALVADARNQFRLYATLDATTEPVVVELPAALGIALVRDGNDFIAALLDDAGGLVVAALDRDGRVTRHAELDGPFVVVTATGDGFLASRADHAVALIDKVGKQLSSLATAADEQAGALAVAHDRAAVVVDTKKGKRVRRLALAPLAWGDWIAGADGLASIALSPSGDRLAGIAGAKAVAIDAASGKPVVSQPATAGSLVGFADDGHIAIAGRNGQLRWLALDPKEAAATATRPAGDTASPAVLATGGGRAITRTGTDLVLATPAQLHYLGYRIQNPDAVAASGGRLLLGDHDRALVDDKLQVIARPTVWAPPDHKVESMRHLGGDDWLVTTRGPRGPSLSIDDLAKGTGAVVRTKATVLGVARGGLVTIASDDDRTFEVARYAPDRHALDAVATISRTGYTLYYPVSPKLADGISLVAVEPRCEAGCKIRWFRDLVHLDRAVELDTRGYVIAAVDEAGHVFVYEDNAGAKQIAIYSDGKQLATLPHADRQIVPDPTGTRYLAAEYTSLTLARVGGGDVWSIAPASNLAPIWFDSGKIALPAPGGIVVVDATTGHELAMTCGWRFELAAQPSVDPPPGESICQARAPKRPVIQIPGDAAFQKLARDVASASDARIFEWGSFPIAGRLHRAATLVGNSSNDSMLGFLVEVAPGKVVDIVFRAFGGTDHQRTPPTDPRWMIGRPVNELDSGAWREDSLALHARWIHGSSESITVTLRDTVPVVVSSSWVERENNGKGHYDETHGGKDYGTPTACAACPPLATFKPHAGNVTVRGPSAKPDDLLVAPDPSWDN